MTLIHWLHNDSIIATLCACAEEGHRQVAILDERAATVHRRLRHRAPEYIPVPRRLVRANLRSFRPPTSPFSQPLQTQYSIRFRRRKFGTRAFSIAGPTVWNWNSLPASLRDPAVESEHFRRDLKTHIFAGH